MQGLPDDIIYDILVRLPIKTLFRFKCANESWFSLISSTQFQNDHYHHSKNNPLLLTIQRIVAKKDDLFTLHLSTYNSNKGILLNNITLQVPLQWFQIRSIQSCLGLVCFETKFIYNPFTNDLTALPPFPRRCALRVGFGFGYAASAKKFKVVMFFLDPEHHDPQLRYRCNVFTVGTSDWREAASPPNRVGSEIMPFLHGVLHFLPQVYSEVQQNEERITGFDVESEEYKVIPLPDCYFAVVDKKLKSMLCLTEIGGSLCLNLGGIGEGQLDLWLLKDYQNGEWVKEYTIHLPSQMINVCWGYSARALAIRGDGGILLETFRGFRIHELLCYDPKEKIITYQIDEGYSGTIYVENFLPL